MGRGGGCFLSPTSHPSRPLPTPSKEIRPLNQGQCTSQWRGPAAGLTQSCPTLHDPMDYSPPGSSVHGISRQEYWSGLPFPPPGDLPNPGIEPRSPASSVLRADSLPAEPLHQTLSSPCLLFMFVLLFCSCYCHFELEMTLKIPYKKDWKELTLLQGNTTCNSTFPKDQGLLLLLRHPSPLQTRLRVTFRAPTEAWRVSDGSKSTRQNFLELLLAGLIPLPFVSGLEPRQLHISKSLSTLPQF